MLISQAGDYSRIDFYSGGDNPRSVVGENLNNDKFIDLVSANFLSKSVGVLLGNGDGTFQDAFSIAVGGNPNDVIIADLDNNGTFDIATADSVSADEGNISVLLGIGLGDSFVLTGTYQVNRDPR